MTFILTKNGKGFSVERNSFVLEDTFTVVIQDAAERGVLLADGKAFVLENGKVTLPEKVLRAGVNRWVYTEGDRRYDLETLRRTGDAVDLPDEVQPALWVCMIQTMKKTEETLSALDERVRALEKISGGYALLSPTRPSDRDENDGQTIT